MQLTVNLRHLEAHPLELKGELSVADLDLDVRDEMIQANEPLGYDLEVQKLEHSLLLRGRLRLVLDCQCVRCLKSFRQAIELEDWNRLLPLEGEDQAPVVNDCVDLTPYVREDILLEFPQHPLCETECRGLPETDRGKAKQPSGASKKQQASSAWAELDKLKF